MSSTARWLAVSSPRTEHDRIVGAVLRARSTFTAGALAARHPELRGRAFAVAFMREQQREADWRAAMGRRVAGDTQAMATMSPVDRARRRAAVLRREQGYLSSQLAETSRRLAWDATNARLQVAGEPGGVWIHDDPATPRPEHLARHGRFFTWDRMPANGEPGCKCRIVSRGEAHRLGVRIREATRTMNHEPWIMESERVFFDPARHPRVAGGHHEGGRFVSVHGDLPQLVRRSAAPLAHANANGDSREDIDRHLERAVRAVHAAIRDPKRRANAIGTLTRMHAAAIDPEGNRQPMTP